MSDTKTTAQPRELVLYCDVDGTLVGPNGDLDPSLVQEIELFVAAGFGFSLATGRSLSGVQRILQQIPINTPLVLCNGTYVYDPTTGQLEYSYLSADLVSEIFPTLQSITDSDLYLERSDGTMWIMNAAIANEPFMLKEGLQPRVFTHLAEVLAGGHVLKMGLKLAEVTQEPPVPLRKFIESSPDVSARLSWCFSSEDYVEIMPVGVSKWSGIQVSQALRGCSDKHIYAVGDQHNDLEMIQFADVGIAMGNAAEEVKQRADFCIGHVQDTPLVQLMASLRSNKRYVAKA